MASRDPLETHTSLPYRSDNNNDILVDRTLLREKVRLYHNSANIVLRQFILFLSHPFFCTSVIFEETKAYDGGKLRAHAYAFEGDS